MLYDAYQAQNDVLRPIRLMAETARSWLGLSWPPIGDMPCVRGAAAAMELLSHAGLSHERPDFRIRSITSDGEEIAVSEEVVASHPFCNLLHFRKDLIRDEPTVLVVAPLSGHFPTLLRGTVETLLADHNVYLTDWKNARDVPLLYGRFDFDDFVELVIRFIRLLGPASQCDGGLPAIGPGVGCGIAAGGRGRPLPAVLDGPDGRPDRHPRQPDRGQPLRRGAPARLVRAHRDLNGAGALSLARFAESTPASCSSPGFSA